MTHKFLLILLSFFLIVNKINSQLAPGEWRDFLPYHYMKQVAVANDKIYCCSDKSLFYYDLTDKSINKISKIQGLSEVEISCIAYSSSKNMLIIAYDNSNIDIIENNRITNIPYIKNKITIPDRRILGILVINNLAYLSCGFGIAVLDLEKLQFKDTYYPSTDGSVNAVNFTCTDSTYIYAATTTGIFKAKLSDPFLADFSHWTLYTNFTNYNKNCSNIQYLNGKLIALFKNFDNTGKNDSIIYLSGGSWYGLNTNNSFSVYSINVANKKLFVTTNRAAYKTDDNFNLIQIHDSWTYRYTTEDSNGNIWIADLFNSLIKISNISYDRIEPNSPFYSDVFKMDIKNNKLWTVAGSLLDDMSPSDNNNGAQAYINNEWQNFNPLTISSFNGVKDLVNVKINPFDDEKVYLASWYLGGLIEYNHGNFNFFNASNSTIQPNFYPTKKKSLKSITDTMYRINGLSFDNSGNLWITNSNVKYPLLVYTSNGNWKKFSLGRSLENSYVGSIIVTSWGAKWIVQPRTTNVIVYDENNTLDDPSDDRDTIISIANVKSLIASNNIYCITEDRQGIIWVGTDAGPVRFMSPMDAFNPESTTAPEKVLVPIVRGQSEATYLLETERINAIAVDGANRKWFGTQNTGAYLISENDNQVSHFTTDNSPLLSNTILDIAINQKTGEVFFATDKGLISYRGFSTEGGDDFGKVYVYPNPVRENYNGNIIVTGLIQNTIVKITDISGNIVYETKSLGGQAVWNGKNLLGKRVNTGIYLVFCSNSDGSKTHVTKLLFIH